MKQLLEFLNKVRQTGEVITVAYGGGSNPGSSRKLIIASCSDDSFRAFDETQRVAKSFKASKVLWIKDHFGNIVTNPEPVTESAPRAADLETLEEYVELLRERFLAQGWHIHQSENFFGVGGYFKNGKPKKTPSIAIAFFLPTTETVYDLDKDDFVEVERQITGRERPWRVDSHTQKQGKTFSKLQSAMEFFVSEVEDSDPNSDKGMYAGH
jgi:hypothetical protein